jgi:tRNA pseudouridine55 synthase
MIQFIDSNKSYSGTIRLGLKSPSMDLETECTEHPLPADLNDEKIFNTRNEFLGEIEQIPPMFSAVKIKGKKLYNLARKGKTITRMPRKIFIDKFEIEKINLPDVEFTITCSKGTYIRAIADEFGNKLGCGGILAELRRIKIGIFDISSALKLEEFSTLFATSGDHVL